MFVFSRLSRYPWLFSGSYDWASLRLPSGPRIPVQLVLYIFPSFSEAINTRARPTAIGANAKEKQMAAPRPGAIVCRLRWREQRVTLLVCLLRPASHWPLEGSCFAEQGNGGLLPVERRPFLWPFTGECNAVGASVFILIM